MSFSTNLLLEALPLDERGVLQSILQSEDLAQHNILFDVRDTIKAVYFPIDAAISLVIPLSSG